LGTALWWLQFVAIQSDCSEREKKNISAVFKKEFYDIVIIRVTTSPTYHGNSLIRANPPRSCTDFPFHPYILLPIKIGKFKLYIIPAKYILI
jgi:hypothetical protein